MNFLIWNNIERSELCSSKCRSVTELLWIYGVHGVCCLCCFLFELLWLKNYAKNKNRNIQGNERSKYSDVLFSSVKDLGVGKKSSRADLSESDTSMANSTAHSTLADNDYMTTTWMN